MSATWNLRRMLRWTTLAGLLAATVALSAPPAAAHDNDRHWRRHHHGQYWGGYGGGYGDGYGYYRPRRHHYRPYYYAPSYYYPPPVYYYPRPYYPRPYYAPSFSFGLTLPID
jgi:hypothetical protein